MSRPRKIAGQVLPSTITRRCSLIGPSRKVERMCRVLSDLHFDVELMAFSPAALQRVFRHFTRDHELRHIHRV